MRAALRSVLMVAAVFVLQVGLLDGLRIFGRASEPLLVLAVSGGLVAGWRRGLRLGFVAGLLYDLVAGTPLGLAAFSYALVAALAGLLQGFMVRMWWLVPPFCAFGLALYVLTGEVVGQDHLYNDRFGVTVGVVTLWAVILAAPTLRLVRWGWRDAGTASPPPRPVSVTGVELSR